MLRSPGRLDLAGRWAFLDAIERWWKPSPLLTLKRYAQPISEWIDWEDSVQRNPRLFFQTLKNSEWPWRYEDLVRETSSAAAAAASALNGWREQFSLSAADIWLLDAALHTVVASAVFQQWPEEWVYNPPVDPRPAFTFEYRQLLPDEALDDYQENLTRAFKNQLKEHVSNLRESLSPNRAFPKHAEWTARSRYETFGQIYRSLPEIKSRRRKGFEVTEDSIKTAVSRFRRSIGLSVPTLGDTWGTPNQERSTTSAIER